MTNILITGGAGFIGSRIAKKLSAAGDHVTVLDSLEPQIHGPNADFAPELAAAAHCVRGDVGDQSVMERLLEDADVLVHLAAETGTGQSMYEVARYTRANIQGTAVLLDVIVNRRPKGLRKIIVASSRALYGEGQYHCAEHGVVFPHARSAAAMAAGRFEPICPVGGCEIASVATDETAPFRPSSYYGLTKQVQEQMVLMFAQTLGLHGIALRYQNVYGPGQSLKNPYTGLLAVFTNLVRQKRTLNIFEDGLESRDFVFIDDVVDATIACIAPQVSGVLALNVGSGVRTSVIEVAQGVIAHFGADVPVTVTGDFRAGDIRHNVANVERLRSLTGFQAKCSFQQGLAAFLAWAEREVVVDSGFDATLEALAARNLMGQATRQ